MSGGEELPPTPETGEGIDVVFDDAEMEGGTILPRVQELLTRIAADVERQRYERFFRAASVAIARLGELDLSGSDHDSLAGPGDPSFWQQIAPAVSASLRRVSGFLEVVRGEFPIAEAEQELALDSAFDDAFSFDQPAAAAANPRPASEPLSDVAKTLQAFCANLGRDLRALENDLKAPALMADRWNLLERLGEFRGRARSAIGEMVFVGARLFAVVRKEDVVPFYREDVNASLALRRTIAALRRRTDVHRARLERLNLETDDTGARACLRAFLDEFNDFTTTEVYRSMRAVDRRTFLEVRRDLAERIERELLQARELGNLVEGVTRFLDSLSLMNQRELLVVHDRETIAEVERDLGASVEAIIGGDLDAARRELDRALQAAQKLSGREPTFDVLLALFTHAKLDELEAADILAMTQLLREQL